jgi:hypothetical protein
LEAGSGGSFGACFFSIRAIVFLMAEYGEWNRKDVTLNDVTARKEYGVDTDFIIEGINAGKLEYREGSIWGNPYIRVLRSQLENYI